MKYVDQNFLNRMEALKEEEMLEALTKEFKTMFPSRTRVLGAENLNLFLVHQQKRAKHYQYNYYDDLKRYALIAFYLGTYFDEDALYPWVQEVLKQEDSFGRKVDLLNEKFYEYFDSIIGKNAIYFQEACKKLKQVSKEHVREYRQFKQIVDTLTYIYPQRMQFIGQENFLKLLKQQKLELERFNIHNALGSSIYATLVFIMGSYVYKDPLFSWVGKYLNYPVGEKEKLDILFERGLNRARKEFMSIEKLIEMEEN